MTQIVVTLPAGKLRWRQLSDSVGLTGDPLSVLLKYLRQPEKGWTQPKLADALGISVYRVRKATNRLQSLGYLIFRNGETDGRGRTESFAFVSDGPTRDADAHPDVDQWIADYWARDRAARGIRARRQRSVPAMTSVQTENNAPLTGTDQAEPHDLQQLKTDTQPTVSGGKSTAFTPLPPAVDNAAEEFVAVAPSAAVAAGPPPGWVPGQGRTVRRLRSEGARLRARVSRSAVPEVVLADPVAIGAAEALGLVNLDRLEMAGYLALCLRGGEDVAELLGRLRSGHKSSKSMGRVMLWRARQWASEHDQGQVELVQAWIKAQWAQYSETARRARRVVA